MLVRTTIDVDEELLKEAMDLLGTKTKREAVRRSLEALVQERRRERLRAKLGEMDLDLSLHSLEEMRQDQR